MQQTLVSYGQITRADSESVGLNLWLANDGQASSCPARQVHGESSPRSRRLGRIRLRVLALPSTGFKWLARSKDASTSQCDERLNDFGVVTAEAVWGIHFPALPLVLTLTN